MAAERVLEKQQKEHFVKPMILADFQELLRIPKEFIKHLEVDKSEAANLRTYRGGERVWSVKVEQRDDHLCFTDGWRKFAQFHDLRIGDCLVFQYQGNMKFIVMIFDPTACEREYPQPQPSQDYVAKDNEQDQAVDDDAHQEHVVEDNDECMVIDDDEIIVIDHEPEVNLKRKRKGTLKTEAAETQKNGTEAAGINRVGIKVTEDSLNRRRIRIPQIFSRAHGLTPGAAVLLDEKQRHWPVKLTRYRSCDIIYITNHLAEFQVANDFKFGESFVLELVKIPVILVCRSQQETGAKTQKSTYERAGNNMSPNSNSSFWYPVRLDFLKHHRMRLPKSFARPNGLHTCSHVVLWDNEHEKCWPVTLTHRSNGNNDTYIGAGLKTFQDENSFQVGESLVLELVNIPVIKVYRCEGTITVPAASPSTKKTGPVISSEHPSFEVKLSRSYCKESRVSIPIQFARNNGLANRICEIKLQNQKRMRTSVQLTYHKSGQVFICEGWGEFSDKNGFKEEDIIEFKLIENGDIPLFECSRREVARTKSPGLSCFWAIVPAPSCTRSFITIPEDFSKDNSLRRSFKMILQNEKGEEWDVELSHGHCDSQVVYMGNGFDRFRYNNGLKEKDTIRFKLLENGEIPRMECCRIYPRYD